jgi:glucose-1-phosphate adenylyltransferase
LQQPGIDRVLILSGDQLYRMDYHALLKTHEETGADATIAGMPVTREQASACGIMRVDESGRVQGFVEKPKKQEDIDLVKMDPKWIDGRGIPSRGRDLLASMGIYVFNRDFLVDVLTKTDYPDFGKEIFPTSVRVRNVQLHLFDGYWEDIGTIKAFFECNLALAGRNPPFQFAQKDAPVYTRARYLPASRIEGATVKNSLISDGVVIGQGAVIENCVIGLRCQIGPNVKLKNCVIMGADEFESEAELMANLQAGRPHIGIGEGSHLEGAIVDKNCRIGRSVRIVNDKNVVDGPDNDECVIRDGIPVVMKDATLKDGWRLG